MPTVLALGSEAFYYFMSARLDLVSRFYHELWNKHKLEIAPDILSPNIIFRGSLGDEKQGLSGVAEYVNRIHTALDKYHCEIIALSEKTDKVRATVDFSGIHQASFLGYPPSGKPVQWQGKAVFRFTESLIDEIQVYSDVGALRRQLESNET